MDEVKPLLLLKPKAYARRWWVLMYISLVMVFIVLSWNTWGPISQSVEYGFGWDNSIIADILTVGRIGAICSIIPLSYLADMKGIRYAMITSTTMVLAGYGFRCAINQSTSTWPALLGQIFVGSGMGIAYSGPVAMSAAWFPPKERATATSITVMCTYFGFGMAYIIHPLLVSTPVFGEDVSSYWNTNQTERINYTDHNLSTAATLTNGSSAKIVLNKDKIQEETMTMTYIETVIAVVLVVVGATLLPNVPPSPPSYSANAVKMGYTRVFVHVKRNGFLCLLILFTGAVVGIYSTWIAIFEIAFGHLGVSQKEAGWLGFSSLIASSVIGFICARFSDMCARKSKTILMFMLVIATVMYLWLSLLCSQYIAFSREQLYVSTILACAFLNGCVPLLYEQICNAAFPIPEGVIVGISAIVTTLAGILYTLPLSLFVFEGNTWLEWSLLVACVLGCIVILVTPQRNGREDMDLSIRVTKPVPYERFGKEHKVLFVESETKVPENA